MDYCLANYQSDPFFTIENLVISNDEIKKMEYILASLHKSNHNICFPDPEPWCWKIHPLYFYFLQHKLSQIDDSSDGVEINTRLSVVKSFSDYLHTLGSIVDHKELLKRCVKLKTNYVLKYLCIYTQHMFGFLLSLISFSSAKERLQYNILHQEQIKAMIRELMDAGINKKRALHSAMSLRLPKDQPFLVEVVLENGCGLHINDQDSHGGTALSHLVRGNLCVRESVILFIRFGAIVCISNERECPFRLSFISENVYVPELLYIAGGKVPNCSLYEYCRIHDKKTEEVFKRLQIIQRNPRSLQEITRKVIRQHMTPTIQSGIPHREKFASLNLPGLIQGYLNYSEFDVDEYSLQDL